MTPFNLIAGIASIAGGVLSLFSILTAICIFVKQERGAKVQAENTALIIEITKRMEGQIALTQNPSLSESELDAVVTASGISLLQQYPASAATIHAYKIADYKSAPVEGPYKSSPGFFSTGKKE